MNFPKPKSEMTEEELEIAMHEQWPNTENMYKPYGWYNDDVDPVFLGDADGQPFTVQVADKGWVAISIVIFAKDIQDAKDRVTYGVRECYNRSHMTYEELMKKPEEERTQIWYKESQSNDTKLSKVKDIIRIIEKGWIFAEPFDKRLIAKVAWASNDTFVF